MKALILNNKVVDTHKTGFPVAPPLEWLDAPDTVRVGFSYQNGQFIEPVPPTPTPLDQIRAIEATITPRRMREAILGTDNGWLAAREAEIAVLRGQL